MENVYCLYCSQKTHPVIPNDFRPIALTSHVMKSLEKNNQNHDYEPHIPSSRLSAICISAGERGGGCSHYSVKPGSWPGRGVEDAATTLLNIVVGLGEGWRMQSLLC